MNNRFNTGITRGENVPRRIDYRIIRSGRVLRAIARGINSVVIPSRIPSGTRLNGPRFQNGAERPMPGICLNMIVKNEMANLQRCLAAVADQLDCWVIADTGSTDGTQDFIQAFFAERKLPGELHSVPFVDFEQARNDALACAYASPLDYDYLLFDDADMELVVEDAAFRDGLAAPGYQMIQRAASGMVYWNTRLVRRDAGARYRGVTHEYLDVPAGTQQLTGAWYKDHASGANRTDKFERDIRLLTNALE